MLSRINFKLLAILLVAACISAVGVHLLHGFQLRRQSDWYLTMATQANEKGEDNQALKYYQMYLRFNPTDDDALVDYCKLVENAAKKARSAKRLLHVFALLEGVLLRHPKMPGVRERQVEISLALADYNTALHYLKELLKDAKETKEKGALKLKIADCLALSRKYTGKDRANPNSKNGGAIDWYAKAAKDLPCEPRCYTARAAIYRTYLDRPKQADEVVLGEMMAAPGAETSFDLHAALARYLLRYHSSDQGKQKQLHEVLHRIEALSQSAEEKATSILLKSQFLLARGDDDGARKLLEEGVRRFPAETSLYTGLVALVLRQEKDVPAALKLIETGLEHRPEDLHLRVARAQLFVIADELDKAEQEIAAIAKQIEDKNDASLITKLIYARGHLALKREQWAKAVDEFETLKTSTSLEPEFEFSVWMSLGRCYQALENPDKALKAFQQAVRIEPTSILARIGVANAYASLERLEDTAAEYRKILLLRPSPTIRLRLASTLLLRNLQKPVADRDWTEIDYQLQKALQSGKDSVNARVLQAEVAFWKHGEDLARAESILRETIESHPDRLEPWLALVFLHGRADPANGLKILSEAVEKHPKFATSPDVISAEIALLSRAASDQAKEKLRSLEPRIAKLPADDAFRVRYQLALAYYRLGEKVQAKSIWRAMLKERPNHLFLQSTLFDVALLEKDVDALTREAEAMRRIEGSHGVTWLYASAVAIYMRASLKSDDISPSELRTMLQPGRRYLAQIRRVRPEWGRLWSLRAAYEELVARPREAEIYYRKAIQFGDRRPQVVRALVDMLLKQRRSAEAEQVVREVLNRKDLLLTAGLGKVATSTLLKARKYSEAEEFARETVPQNSNDFRDYLWLAQVYSAINKSKKADEYYQKALKLRRWAPEAWSAYVGFLARSGRKDDAKAALQAASKQMIGDDAILALAEGHEALGELQQAASLFLKAYQDKPDDIKNLKALAEFHLRRNQLSQARPLLEKVVDKANTVSTQDLRWARRSLALVLLGDRRYPSTMRALNLVAKNLAAGTVDVNDLRVKALVLATHPSKRREAIRAFGEVKKQQALSNQDLLILATLHESEGNHASADVIWQELLDRPDGGQPALYDYYIRSLLKRDRLAEARFQLQRLLKRYPDALLSYSAKASVLQREGKHTEAIAALARFAKSDIRSAYGAARALQSLAAKAKDQANLYLAAAESIYKDLQDKADAPIDVKVSYFELACQRKQWERAKSLLEDAFPKLPEKLQAQAMIAVLAIPDVPKHYLEEFSNWVATVLKEKPRSIPLLLVLGHAYNQQREYDRAIAVYEKVLEIEADSLVAANNLAWLLSVHSNRTDRALIVLQRAFAAHGPLPTLLDTRGFVKTLAGDYRQALTDFALALRMQETATTHFHRAYALFQANRRREAKRAWQAARAAGLTPEKLHPLELPFYRQLEAKLP